MESKSSQDTPSSAAPLVEPPAPPGVQAGPRSLRELVDMVSGRGFRRQVQAEDAGILDLFPFPFLALVGQQELKLALILALINPGIGGVLLIGPRGTGKTTAVRSLIELLPEVPRSLCYYGCMPEDIETGGIEAVCPDCAQKYGRGEPLSRMGGVNLIELPLNSRLEDVVVGFDERAMPAERLRIRRGLLAQADRNLLYIDEINLLNDEIIDAILDASSQGHYTVRRGPVSASYRARFTLIGSMNPEEGNLRPQIMDRFGLRVALHGLPDGEQRLEAYHRVQAFQTNPRLMVAEYASETLALREEIQQARRTLLEVVLPEEIAHLGLEVIRRLQIDSLRAEITLFEAVRAHAAADGRRQVALADLVEIAPMVLRGRSSTFMIEFLAAQNAEKARIVDLVKQIVDPDYSSETHR